MDDPQIRQAIVVMDQLAYRDQPIPGWDMVNAVRAGWERDRGLVKYSSSDSIIHRLLGQGNHGEDTNVAGRT